LHELKEDRKGTWTIKVSENWRITRDDFPIVKLTWYRQLVQEISLFITAMT
jgi:plasmid maintenance system killer protein